MNGLTPRRRVFKEKYKLGAEKHGRQAKLGNVKIMGKYICVRLVSRKGWGRERVKADREADRKEKEG